MKEDSSSCETRNTVSSLTSPDLARIRERYGFPERVPTRLPSELERADTVSEGWMCVYESYFECGLRFPIPELVLRCLSQFGLAISQLMPNTVRVLMALMVVAEEAKVELSVEDVNGLYFFKENCRDKGRYSIVSRVKQIIKEKNSDRQWNDRYFYARVNADSVGSADRSQLCRPWTTINQDDRRPHCSTLVFKRKLEALLAVPDRDWGDFNAVRFRRSSVWKNPISSSSTDESHGKMRRPLLTAAELMAKRKAEISSAARAKPVVTIAAPNEPERPNQKEASRGDSDQEPAGVKRRRKVVVEIPQHLSVDSDPEVAEEVLSKLVTEKQLESLERGCVSYEVWARDMFAAMVRGAALLHKSEKQRRESSDQLKQQEAALEELRGDRKESSVLLRSTQATLAERNSKIARLQDQLDEQRKIVAQVKAELAEKDKELEKQHEIDLFTGRYDLLLEYKAGRHHEWDVEGEISIIKELIECATQKATVSDDTSMTG